MLTENQLVLIFEALLCRFLYLRSNISPLVKLEIKGEIFN
jgi:hypothetical protein